MRYTNIRAGNFQNQSMATLLPAVNISEPVRRSLDLLNRDIERQFVQLSTAEQNEFWTNLQGYALAQTENKGRRASLLAPGRVRDSVRRVLELIDAATTEYTAGLTAAERGEFWKVLHRECEQQAEQTKQPASGQRRHSNS